MIFQIQYFNMNEKYILNIYPRFERPRNFYLKIINSAQIPFDIKT